MKILWFKKNLRTLDSRLLASFTGSEEVLGIYFFEPSILGSPDFSNFHLQFIVESLIDLENSLESLNIPLIFLPLDALEGFMYLRKNLGNFEILSHEETGNRISYQRDIQVLTWAKKEVIKVQEFPNNGVVRRLKSRNEWNKIWNIRMKQALISPQKCQHLYQISGELQKLSKETFEQIQSQITRNPKIQIGGEKAALRVLQSFLDTRSKNYIYSISKPDLSASGCSRLSPYITNGNISIKYIFQKSKEKIQKLKQENSEESKKRIRNINFFLSRIHWQSHFIQKLEDEPEMEWRNINHEFDTIRQESDEELVEKVFAGQSGIPFIDAIARCLARTGRINFRARATFVSFLCNTCMQPWQKIVTKLARVFTDYEPGIHYPQLQMQAGTTGMNTIRVYNPIKQALEKDQDGRFIRYWIPEIAHLDTSIIADPKLHPEGLAYPKALVDVEEANRRARLILWGTKRKKETREISKRVFEKHGSRVFKNKKIKKELLQISLFD